MGRIYMAYALRRVFRSSTLRATLSVGSLLWILSVVSVLHVAKNMLTTLSSPSDLYTFSVTALSKTEFTVQISLVLFAVAALWYVRDLLKYHTPLHSSLAQ